MIDNAAVYVNESIIKKNKELLERKFLKSKTKIIAVIKANGYGAGLLESAKLFEKLGIDALAVLSVSEGVSLRKSGISLPILLLGSTLKANYKYLTDYDLTQAVFSYENAEAMNRYALEKKRKIKVHVKIDTGLNRLGLKDIEQVKKIYSMQGLNATGIYSHFVSGQSSDPVDKKLSQNQIMKFKKILLELKEDNIDPGITHLQNSPSILNYGDLGFDAVRCGMILYGLFHPEQKDQAEKLGFSCSLSLKARIALVKEIKEGEYVGYARGYQAKKDMKIATVAAGYCDGIMRSLSKNNGCVVYQNRKYPILGEIAMSQFMIDVSHSSIKAEDEVLLFGDENQTIYDYIEITGQTINELVSHLRLDMRRVYLK